jgi:MFS transporter, DHA2 family, methylenomycin A resistance protein
MSERRGNPFAALTVLSLGLFMTLLDVTIVNVAIPQLLDSIGASIDEALWVINAYVLVLGVLLITAGRLGDIFGPRNVYLVGTALFTLSSAACGLSNSPGALIAARAVQGLGGSALLPCSLALIVHQFPDPRARARALGVWGGMGSAGVALGPVAGGALIAAVGWRSIFGVNVPICLLTVVLLRRFADESPRHPDRRTDVPGLLLGAAMLAGFTAAFITAGEQGWLTPLPGALLAGGLLAGWAFIHAERRHPHPVLPLALFRNKNLSGATGVGLIFNLVLYGSLLCLSLYLQTERHEPVLATGLLLLPMSVTVGLGSLVSGRLTARFGPLPPMLAGLTIAAAGAALLATAGPASPLALIGAGSILLGLVSLAMPAMTAAVVGAAGREHAGVASGVLNAARQSGGALGVAVLGSLLGHGHPLSLHVPLLVATAGYLVAIALALASLRR